MLTQSHKGLRDQQSTGLLHLCGQPWTFLTTIYDSQLRGGQLLLGFLYDQEDRQGREKALEEEGTRQMFF